MKNKRQFIAGFLTCLILLSAIYISAFAEGISILPNSFPILFNGQSVEIEAYNINGRTFLALGDVAKYFNATAIFNETTKQIEINTKDNFAQSIVSGINETIVNDKFEITLLSVEYHDFPPDETNQGRWYFSDPSVNMALVKYKIKNITDHDVKLPFPVLYKDEYKEKKILDGIPNTLMLYAPEYCKNNSIGYDRKINSGYLKSNQELTLTIDYPVKVTDSIKCIEIDNITFKL